MDKVLEHHDLQVYENLVKNCMVPGLEKLDRLIAQKYLNPKMMNETKSVLKKLLS